MVRSEGSGTGVLRAYYSWFIIRGLTTGIAGAGGLFISRATGCPQHWLFASRGIGQAVAPALLGKFIGRVVWSGNSEAGFVVVLGIKMIAEVALPRLMRHSLLCLAFFFCGVSTALMDCMGTILVTRIHGKHCGPIMSSYDTVYSVGCMLAPFVVVQLHEKAWDGLAVIDMILAALIVRKRLLRGKPRGWKAKIRGPVLQGTPTADEEATSEGGDSGSPKSPAAPPQAFEAAENRVPARVIATGLVFTVMSQLAMTAVSVWGFTYGSNTMRLQEKAAALVPVAFYGANLAIRALLMRLPKSVLPSTVLHVGACTAVTGAFLFFALGRKIVALSEAQLDEEVEGALPGVAALVPFILTCFAMLGAGYAPNYSLCIGAMQQHGEMTPQEHGWYGTAVCLGVTFGLYLPGVVNLPSVEVVTTVSMIFLLSLAERDFPRFSKKSGSQGNQADAALGG